MGGKDDISIFGAGIIGRAAFHVLQDEGYDVRFFIDNDEKKWGSKLNGVSVIGLEAYKKSGIDGGICVCCKVTNRDKILRQLAEAGISDVFCFDDHELWEADKRERVLSYSHVSDLEDVILYHVLHDVPDIFYIDVGSNDPWTYSVTKLFYDKGAHGINIDPLPEMIDLSVIDRPRDVNLCVACGTERGTAKLYCQGVLTGGGSTMVEQNCNYGKCQTINTSVIPLRDICEQFIPMDTGGGYILPKN